MLWIIVTELGELLMQSEIQALDFLWEKRKEEREKRFVGDDMGHVFWVAQISVAYLDWLS